MGLFPARFVAALKARGIAWFANVTTVAEARAAEAAGADAIVAQGMEAGGHRGASTPAAAERQMVGLFALLPAVADAVTHPGHRHRRHRRWARRRRGADPGRQRRADRHRLPALPGGEHHPAWADALADRAARGHGGHARLQRAASAAAIATDYARAAAAPDAPRAGALSGATRPDRSDARRGGAQATIIERMQAWAGQAATLARAEPAAEIARRFGASRSTFR